jgi:hypothetical protein
MHHHLLIYYKEWSRDFLPKISYSWLVPSAI